MPKTKKSIVADVVDKQPTVPQQEEPSSIIPVAIVENKDLAKNTKSKKKATPNISPEIQKPVVEVPKEKFKQLHIEDTFWLENDIYQTVEDMTEGKKGAKALIINQALKDYFKKNNMEITPLKAKGKKN